MTSCSWAVPGVNKYTGTVEAALLTYGFSAEAQDAIAVKVRRNDPDGLVTITRDGVESQFGATAGGLRDMWFGAGSRCSGEVDRSAWAAGHREDAFVYCAGADCVAIPRVCGNVSRIDWAPYIKPEVEIRPEWDSYVPRHAPGTTQQHSTNTVPEPGSIALVALALIAMAVIHRRRKQ